MYVSKLSLTNFRSYQQLDLTLTPGVTTFVGNNGAGKTNIAESLIFLSFLTSHRTPTNQPLISLGAEQAIIRAEIVRGDRNLQIDLEVNANKANRVKLNQNPTKSQREILGACQVIYFSPEDLDLVRGEPTNRRDFLDKLLITKTPRLAGVLSDYDRVLKQRNTLLRTRAPQSAIAPWTEQLINFASAITAERMALVESLNPLVAANYKKLNEVKPASIIYKSNIEGLSTNPEINHQLITTKLLEVQYQEVERGITLVGPHRDDLILQLGDYPAKGYASHGESWSFAISLKIGALELLKSQGLDPILILDDVFAELDTNRRTGLVQATKLAEQTIVTAAVEGDLPADLSDLRFYVSNGEVSK
ncbi:MAG: DNA replication/repair protein RecF [Candidatus Nanopelagicaceae bacterium]